MQYPAAKKIVSAEGINSAGALTAPQLVLLPQQISRRFGVVFGLYSVHKAVRLNPIDAQRYE